MGRYVTLGILPARIWILPAGGPGGEGATAPSPEGHGLTLTWTSGLMSGRVKPSYSMTPHPER